MVIYLFFHVHFIHNKSVNLQVALLPSFSPMKIEFTFKSNIIL